MEAPWDDVELSTVLAEDGLDTNRAQLKKVTQQNDRNVPKKALRSAHCLIQSLVDLGQHSGTDHAHLVNNHRLDVSELFSERAE